MFLDSYDDYVRWWWLCLKPQLRDQTQHPCRCVLAQRASRWLLHWRKVDLCLFHSLERQRPEGQTSEQDVQWAEVGVVRQRLDAVTGGRGNIDPVITRELHACRQVHQVPSTRVRWEPPPETRTGLIFVVGKLVIAARSHQQHELVIKSGLYEAAARLLLASIRVFLLIFSFT